MQPGIEYLRVITNHAVRTFTCEYFDLESYRKEVIPYTAETEMQDPFSSDWKQTDRHSEIEIVWKYYQRPKPGFKSDEGFWDMLKSKLGF